MITLPNSLPDWVTHRARTAPASEALRVGDRTWSYEQLDAEVTRLARRLASLGVGASDRVGSVLHNGLHAALLPHVTLRLGATMVPLNVRLGRAEAAWQLGHSAPKVVLVQRDTAALASDSTVPCVSVDGAAPGCQELSAVPERDVPLQLKHDASHVLAVMYTSGTTGKPKGAMLTVGNFWWSAEASALNLGKKPDDRWLAVLPLFHVGGLSIVLRSAIYGTGVVIHDRFDAAVVNRSIERDGVTIASVVAVTLQRMLDERDDAPYPASFRCALVGGGPVPPALLKRCARAGVPVVQTYGLTECASQVATLSPEDALRKAGSAGRALYGVELAVEAAVDSDDGSGEIMVKGPIVMSGYLNDPEATSRVLDADGWLRTGDVGLFDADGYLYVLDRREDLIVSGGENVYPAEVEAVLLEHPWVEEGAVVGVPDKTWGHSVVAVVRLRPGTDVSPLDAAEALRVHCREKLAGYKTPREFRVVTDPLPRTASGKLRRSLLRIG